MKAAITISLVAQAKGGPFVFWDDLKAGCERAAALGFHAVEIFAPSADVIDRKALHRLLGQYGLEVCAVGSGAGWVIHKWHLCHADPEIRRQAREFIRQIIEMGGEFQAPAIIGSMQGRFEGEVTRPQGIQWLGEALNYLGEQAARHQQPLLFEPLNRYETNMFNRLGDAATFLQSLEVKNAKLLADLFHMNIEETSIADALRAAGQAIGHVHFVDSNRLAIGLGHIDMGPVVKALGAIGYAGYVSGEVLPLPDSETAAQQTIRAYKQWVSA